MAVWIIISMKTAHYKMWSISLSFPMKTNYWERKSPHACTVLMKYDSSLTVYECNRWSLLFWLYMYSLHNILSSFSQLINVSQEKKKKIKWILLSETTRHKHLTHIYRLINKYDTFLKYASFVVLLKKHYSMARWTTYNLCF